MNQMRFETKNWMQVGKPVAVGERTLIPVCRVCLSVGGGPDHPCCFGTVEPEGLVVVDLRGEYLLSLSEETLSLEKALEAIPNLGEAIKEAHA